MVRKTIDEIRRSARVVVPDSLAVLSVLSIVSKNVCPRVFQAVYFYTEFPRQRQHM